MFWSQTETDSEYIHSRMLRLEISGEKPGGTTTRRFMEVKLVGGREVVAEGRARWKPVIGCRP